MTPNQTPELRELRGTYSPETFRAFVCRVAPKYLWYPHCELLAAVLQRVADGELKRVMIYEPPRHGKSELCSRLFTAYFLSRYPHRWVGLCSHTADLAYGFSRNARENYILGGGALQSDATAVKHWQTGQGGGLWAAGVGGAITGKGFHLGLIDDWVKNAADAASLTLQARNRDWYGSTYYTREEPWSDTDPNGAIVIIGTRWNENDLAGSLLAAEIDADEPEGWHIVNLPAIAEDDAHRQTFPDTCTVEPDFRSPGEALCPERRPCEKLRGIAERIGEYFFTALFQQRPSPAGGNLFKTDWFAARYTGLPQLLEVWTTWDTALKTAEQNDETACAVMGSGVDGNVYVLRISHGRWETPDVATFLVKQAQWLKHLYAERYRGDYVEDKVSGTTLMQYVRRQFPRLVLIPVAVDADKVTRAHGVTPLCQAARVLFPDPDHYPAARAWITASVHQITNFPNGAAHDDIVDAFVNGLKRFLGTLRATGSRRGQTGGVIG